VLEILRYADEVTRAQTYFRNLPDDKADADLLDLATTIIEKKTAPFKPEEFHDRYVDALQRLIEKKKKAKGKRIIEDVEEPASAKGGNVIDLMAALKKSVGDGGKATPAKKVPAKAAATKPRTPAKRKSA
jgi:DNA end-binding protein Ku